MEELDALNSRYRALADQRDGVLFVSAADVMRWDKNPEYYAEDQIHPSPLGSEAVGTYVGERVLAGQ